LACLAAVAITSSVFVDYDTDCFLFCLEFLFWSLVAVEWSKGLRYALPGLVKCLNGGDGLVMVR